MTSIAKDECAPVVINLLDLVDMSKDFAQISTTNNKKTAKPEKYYLTRSLKIYGIKGHATVQSELSQVHDRGVFETKNQVNLPRNQ